jgi:hypothetical protein
MSNRSYKDEIRVLLKRAGFYRVMYNGPIHMMGSSRVLFYDADFWQLGVAESFSPREFLMQSKTRKTMDRIVAIFRQRRVRHGTVIEVSK